ncbi:gamma-glutamylcyclotransferase [Mongoliitalea daihaiensis]|nr:gamma-glutamylcyclotransferase [Mongoliitalea daihaiensis]
MNNNHIYYFGYASNLDIETLKGRLPAEPNLMGIGLLENHEFQFSFPNPDGSARANIHAKEGGKVFGLVFQISASAVDYFLNSEPGYDFIPKEILVGGALITAYTFQSKIRREGLTPSKEYIDTIVRGGQTQDIPSWYLEEVISKSI